MKGQPSAAYRLSPSVAGQFYKVHELRMVFMFLKDKNNEAYETNIIWLDVDLSA